MNDYFFNLLIEALGLCIFTKAFALKKKGIKTIYTSSQPITILRPEQIFYIEQNYGFLCVMKLYNQ